MSRRPSLARAVNWRTFEKAILSIVQEALRRLCLRSELPSPEIQLNFQLHREMLRVHREQLDSRASTLPFCIVAECSNQPVLDDEANDPRLQKRPDFSYILTDAHAASKESAQVYFNVECKRLGIASSKKWVFNENYAEHGVQRFVHTEWQYAKGCPSGAMVGYMQTMDPDSILEEVNTAVTARCLPTLEFDGGWDGIDVVRQLSQGAMTREVAPSPFQLRHLWVDIRGRCVRPKSDGADRTRGQPD